MSNEEAEQKKTLGNEAFKAGNFEDAIKQYNKAITLDPENASYYSNRSAAWSKKGNHDSALADANRCVQKDPSFVKGYVRQGKALFDQGKPAEAEKAYKEGLAKEPGNEACERGLADMKAKKKAGGSRSSSSGGGAMAGGVGGMVQMVIDKLKSGGRIQTYMMVLMGYFLFTQFSGRNKTGSDDSMQVADAVAEDDNMAQSSGATTPTLSRRFKEFDGTWLSYMGTEGKSDTMLLMLHRTSRSAEVEFSTAFEKVASRSTRIVAPDRPCHGFSPCPTAGEPDAMESAWLNRLVRAGGVPERIAVIAVGREAAAQALSLAAKRREVMHIMLLSPKVVAPARGKMTEAKELTAWLSKNGYPTTGQVAADAIRWAAAGESNKAQQPLDLAVDKLPQDCRVSILYEAADEQDEDLEKALESQGTEVKTRSIEKEEDISDVIAFEIQQALQPESAGVDEER